MGNQSKCFPNVIKRDTLDWYLGLVYIVAVAAIWIAASYLVQTVVDEGVSPFLLSYICNSLFLVYIPIIEFARCFENLIGYVCFWQSNANNVKNENSENPEIDGLLNQEVESTSVLKQKQWSRSQVAKVSLLICPFWFFAQFTFNLSLKYTSVTSNTILSSTSSLFTFLVSLAFLGENFTWMKLISVLLCMGGTVIVSLADSNVGVNAIATNPVLGDTLAIVSACLYAVYISLIRKKLPDERKGEGKASMAEFLGYLGLFNLLIFFPIGLILNFTKIEVFNRLTWYQFGLIVAKGLLDNVLSDYLWAKAVLLTTTTVATAGLTIQVPIAALIDSILGHPPHILNYIGAFVIMAGFIGINVPEKPSSQSEEREQEA